MHISEGILSGKILLIADGLTCIGLHIGIKKMDYKRLPEVAVLSSVFFVASLIHIPIGPASVHLVLNGLVGILLGWMAFPSMFLSLALQALLFQFGGITTLGVNTFNMAMPGVIVYYFFHTPIQSENSIISNGAAFAAGFLSILGACLLVSISLITSEQSFLNIARMMVIAHIPIMIIEGLITVFCIRFIRTVKPEILSSSS